MSELTLFVLDCKAALAELPALFSARDVKTAFISTPDKFHIAQVTSEDLTVADEKGKRPLDPALFNAAYEVRAFGPTADIRWVREGMSGRALVLTEQGEGKAHRCIYKIERQYFSWRNDPDARLDGWSVVSASRVGTLFIPAPHADGRLCLRAFEYVQAGVHGNAFVVAERYAGFTRVTEQQRDAR